MRESRIDCNACGAIFDPCLGKKDASLTCLFITAVYALEPLRSSQLVRFLRGREKFPPTESPALDSARPKDKLPLLDGHFSIR